MRLLLEESIDNFINDPVETEKISSIVLEAQGIDSNFDTILSFINGSAWGLTMAFYFSKHKRPMNENESLDFLELMKRRASELRQAFIDTRIRDL